MQYLFEKAISIALFAHKGQVDKGGHPYILHPIRIMMLMETMEERITAILHDVVEDSEVTVQNLKEDNFPDIILKAIDLLTKKENQTYDNYILMIKENPLACKVKLADLKDNMNRKRLDKFTKEDKQRFKKYNAAYKLLKQNNN